MNQVRFQGESPAVYYEFDKDSAPLGEGGMGCIYRGVRVDTAYGIQNVVAIKCIKPELVSNQSVIQRAQSEAAVQIDDKGLIRMYGFFAGAEYNAYTGTYQPGYYIAMELIEGVNLDEVLFKNVTTDKFGNVVGLAQDVTSLYSSDKVSCALYLMVEILRSVGVLHQHGFIHRDIDPSNVMLTQSGDIKLIDFGISKRFNVTNLSNGLTRAGQFLGKYAFAAPELLLGDLNSQGPKTDIYSMGILFYLLLTGHLPVTGSDSEVRTAHLDGKLDYSAISNKRIRKIVEKATSVNLSDRYSSTAEMIGAITAVSVTLEKSKPSNNETVTTTDSEQAPSFFARYSAFVAAPIGLAIGAAIAYLLFL